MERKVSIEVNGRTVRVMKHTLDDVIMLGGNTLKRPIKNPPKELNIIPKTIDISADTNNLPKMVTSKTEIEIAREKLDELGIEYHPRTGLKKLNAKLNEGNKK